MMVITMIMIMIMRIVMITRTIMVMMIIMTMIMITKIVTDKENNKNNSNKIMIMITIMILLMAEILHHLGCMNPINNGIFTYIYHINWLAGFLPSTVVTIIVTMIMTSLIIPSRSFPFVHHLISSWISSWPPRFQHHSETLRHAYRSIHCSHTLISHTCNSVVLSKMFSSFF